MEGEGGRKREKEGEGGRRREKEGEGERRREKEGEGGRRREKKGEGGRRRRGDLVARRLSVSTRTKKRTIDSLDQRKVVLVMKGDLHFVVNGDL